MKLSPVYLRWRKDTLEQGRREGQQTTKRQITECCLNVRFASPDPELLAIIEPMLQLSPKELARLLLNASREELLERFSE